MNFTTKWNWISTCAGIGLLVSGGKTSAIERCRGNMSTTERCRGRSAKCWGNMSTTERCRGRSAKCRGNMSTTERCRGRSAKCRGNISTTKMCQRRSSPLGFERIGTFGYDCPLSIQMTSLVWAFSEGFLLLLLKGDGTCFAYEKQSSSKYGKADG